MENDESMIIARKYKSDPPKEKPEIHLIPLDKIIENPMNEEFFDVEDVDILADSIRNHKFTGAITVVKTDDDKYMIVDGHRRIQAVKSLGEEEREKLGLSQIPCNLQSISDDDTMADTIMDVNMTGRRKKLSELVRIYCKKYELLTAEDLKRVEEGKEKPKGDINDRIGEIYGVSGSEVSRIRALEKLGPALLRFADKDRFPVTALDKAINLSTEQKEELLEELKKLEKENGRKRIQSKQVLEIISKIRASDAKSAPVPKKEPVPIYKKKVNSFERGLEKFASSVDNDKETLQKYIAELEAALAKFKEDKGLKAAQ